MLEFKSKTQSKEIPQKALKMKQLISIKILQSLILQPQIFNFLPRIYMDLFLDLGYIIP